MNAFLIANVQTGALNSCDFDDNGIFYLQVVKMFVHCFAYPVIITKITEKIQPSDIDV